MMEFLGLADETWVSLKISVHLVQTGLGLCIAALALVGYRRQRTRSMLALAVGVALLTFVSYLVTLATVQVVPPAALPIPSTLTETVGLLSILYAIVLARRE